MIINWTQYLKHLDIEDDIKNETDIGKLFSSTGRDDDGYRKDEMQNKWKAVIKFLQMS